MRDEAFEHFSAVKMLKVRLEFGLTINCPLWTKHDACRDSAQSLDRLAGSEAQFVLTSDDDARPAMFVAIYRDFPERGALTGFTIGLSHFQSDDGGCKELFVCMGLGIVAPTLPLFQSIRVPFQHESKPHTEKKHSK